MIRTATAMSCRIPCWSDDEAIFFHRFFAADTGRLVCASGGPCAEAPVAVSAGEWPNGRWVFDERATSCLGEEAGGFWWFDLESDCRGDCWNAGGVFGQWICHGVGSCLRRGGEGEEQRSGGLDLYRRWWWTARCVHRYGLWIGGSDSGCNGEGNYRPGVDLEFEAGGKISRLGSNHRCVDESGGEWV